jgi:two-component system, OmpR family, sensor histidine kinase VicK
MSYAGSPQKTVVLEGVGSITEALQGLYSRVRNRCDRYEMASGIPPMTQSNKIKELLINLRKRGVRIRQITEITKDNVIYCKQVMEILELRHLEHVRVGMEVNDDEFIVTGNHEDSQTIANLSKDTRSSTRANATSSYQVIYCNVRQLVEQQQSIFDLLWSKAIPGEQRIKEIEEGKSPSESKVLYGPEDTTNTILNFLSNAKSRVNICADHNSPSITIGFDVFRSSLLDIKNILNMNSRFLTEITKANLSNCKELLKVVGQLRHLDNIKGSFAVSESEYIATTDLEEGKPIAQLIYSNVNDLVEQHEYLFDMLWDKAVPAELKIREIEEGVVPYKTKVIDNSEEIIQEIGRLASDSNELATCLTAGGILYSHYYFFNIKKKLLDKQRKGEHMGIRYVTSIEKENLEIAKLYLDNGIQIKHFRTLPPMSFGVSDKEIAATIEKMEGGRVVGSLLISNEPAYVKHFTAVFEELWTTGIDAIDRIRDIEEGVDLADIEIIANPREGIRRAWHIIKSAQEEVSIIFSSVNALRRQIQMGGAQLLKEVSENCGAKIRLLVPSDIENDDNRIITKLVDGLRLVCPKVDIRIIDKGFRTRITIVAVDERECIIIELKDDTKDVSHAAAGLSTYSNSKSIVSSYTSIFKNLWKQTELNKQLKIHDKMQKELINLAAHELRTPVQPLIMSIESMKRSFPNDERISIILRSAERLQKLSNDILDVTRIEGNTLRLNLENVDLNEIIIGICRDFGVIGSSNIISNNKGIKFNYKFNQGGRKQKAGKRVGAILVRADKSRLIQVVFNLLSNAVNSIKELEQGKLAKDRQTRLAVKVEQNRQDDEERTISISVEENTSGGQAIVSIRDTGIGIDPEILSRLFCKFATKSFDGIGLGLYICKGIIEAHGGIIWAKNNYDEQDKGATFSFSLPLKTS